jgi:hypothetical protein
MLEDRNPKDGGVAESVDPQTLVEMGLYVKQNRKKEVVDPYPQKWMGDVERAAFASVTESLLGEHPADLWLQNHVFKGLGSDYLDFDSPLSPEDQIVPADDMPDFGPLSLAFMKNFPTFLDHLVRSMGNMQKFSTDPERIQEGMFAGIAYALNAPKPGNMDQRLNFFALFPANLNFEAISKYYEIANDARHLTAEIRNCLVKRNFVLKATKELTAEEVAAGMRAMDSFRSKNPRLKDAFIEALSPIAKELIEYLERIITAGRPHHDLQSFIGFHISKRTLSARTKEGKRKEHEVALFYENEDGDQSFDAEISVREEVTENGVTRTSPSNRHAYARNETYEEKLQIANAAKDFTTTSLDNTAAFTEMLIRHMRDEAVVNFEEKDRLNTKTNDSDILGLLLPEALHYYVKAAISQADAIIRVENETPTANRRGLLYKVGRSKVSYGQSGRGDLGSLVDLKGLERHLRPYRDLKLAIYDLHRSKKDVDTIIRETGADRAFVEDTIRQIKLINKQKGGKTVDEYFSSLDAANIKNGFSWRWGRIMAILYEPLKNDPINTELLKGIKNVNEPKKWPILIRRKMRRCYHLIDSSALADFVSMLTVHAFISKGTIPDKVYPKAEQNTLAKIDNLYERYKAIKDKANTQPGIAWGHNVCRATGESNLQMFYDIFYGGLHRDDPEHKILRDRAALVIRMRRAKANKNGGRADSED